MARSKIMPHPALALMRHAANGHLTRFQTDLTVHDATALAAHAPTDAFAWILHTGATWLAFMGPGHRTFKFAAVFVHSYSAEQCRFFFWNGGVLTEYRCAADLDDRIEDFEHELRDRKRASELADRGVA